MLPGDVPKWLRGGFAKPVFTGSNPVVASIFPVRAPSMTEARRQFRGGVRRLWAAPMLALASCSDPPPPPPVADPAGVPRWSTAPYVRWAGPRDPSTGPLAVFVDHPGGPLDRIAADPDVTTFLNDRFVPWFLTPSAAEGLPPAPAALWLDPRGCVLAGPLRPASPDAWIATANAVLQAGPDRPTRPLDPRPSGWSFELPAGHPLRSSCARP